MSHPNTVRVKSAHQSQGKFVVINVADFDEKKHQRYDEKDADEDRALAEQKAADEAARLVAEAEAKKLADAKAADTGGTAQSGTQG